jgi:hypothetical protein
MTPLWRRSWSVFVRSPVAGFHGFVLVGFGNCFEPPVSVDFIISAKKVVVGLVYTAFRQSSSSKALATFKSVLLHGSCICGCIVKGCARAVSAWSRSVGKEARICCSELEGYHFCPTQVDDNAAISKYPIASMFE